MIRVDDLLLMLATYLIISARSTLEEVHSIAILPVQIGFNVSNGVWYFKWSRSLSVGSRLVFSDCGGRELSRFEVNEECASAEVAGITRGRNVFLRAESRDFTEDSSAQDFLNVVSIDLDPTGSFQPPSEFELTPGECFESQLFSGSLNCSTNLQVCLLIDGIGNCFSIFSPSLPPFVSYMLSADNGTLSICLTSNVMSHENVKSSLTIQEMCIQQASHICNNESDDQPIIYYGNRGILPVKHGLASVKRCVFSASEIQDPPTNDLSPMPTSNFLLALSSSSPSDATSMNKGSTFYIQLIVGGTVLFLILGILFLLLCCIVATHNRSLMRLTRHASVVYKNSLALMKSSTGSRTDEV